jgi:hypothetical protein
MRFTISESRETGRRVQYDNGKIIVTKMKDSAMLSANERQLVAEAHLDPLSKLQQIEKLVAAGKVDAKALTEILAAKPDFDKLAAEPEPATA